MTYIDQNPVSCIYAENDKHPNNWRFVYDYNMLNHDYDSIRPIAFVFDNNPRHSKSWTKEYDLTGNCVRHVQSDDPRHPKSYEDTFDEMGHLTNHVVAMDPTNPSSFVNFWLIRENAEFKIPEWIIAERVVGDRPKSIFGWKK